MKHLTTCITFLAFFSCSCGVSFSTAREDKCTVLCGGSVERSGDIEVCASGSEYVVMCPGWRNEFASLYGGMPEPSPSPEPPSTKVLDLSQTAEFTLPSLEE